MNDSTRQPGAGGFEQRRRDFGMIERALEPGAVSFVERVGIPAGARVLDVGCGTGKCGIAAAKLGGDVTAVDSREPFLSRGRAWAKNEDLLIRFQPFGEPRLPFSDGNFQVSLCFLWLPFASDPSGLVAQMRRVTRPGGTIALALWHPDSVIADMLALAYQYAGDETLARNRDWFRENAVRAAFGKPADNLESNDRAITLSFPFGPEAVAECYLAYHPSLSHTAGTLNSDRRGHLLTEMAGLWRRAGIATEDSTRVETGFREIVLRG